MNTKVQAFLFGGAVLTFSMISMVFSPMAAYADTPAGGKQGVADRPRMQRMLGVEAPLITIALNHRTELSLTADQVATLEKVRSHYQSQMTPIQEQLRAIEGEIAALLQESPANLIQVRLKIEQAEKLRSELRYQRVEALENGKSVLTAQQRDQLKNIVASAHRGFRRPQGQAS